VYFKEAVVKAVPLQITHRCQLNSYGALAVLYIEYAECSSILSESWGCMRIQSYNENRGIYRINTEIIEKTANCTAETGAKYCEKDRKKLRADVYNGETRTLRK
jgi:hypothetical protein